MPAIIEFAGRKNAQLPSGKMTGLMVDTESESLVVPNVLGPSVPVVAISTGLNIWLRRTFCNS